MAVCWWGPVDCCPVVVGQAAGSSSASVAEMQPWKRRGEIAADVAVGGSSQTCEGEGGWGKAHRHGCHLNNRFIRIS